MLLRLAAHEERFRRIYTVCLERPAGDYAELLRRGEVSSPDGVDPEAWREEIRRQARHGKVRVTTYLSRLRRACVRDAQPHGRGRSSVRGQAAGA